MSTTHADEDASNPSARRHSRQNALKAACLAAGLTTAFIAPPAHALQAVTGFQATNGGQSTPIYDGYFLNSSPVLDPLTSETPSPVFGSLPAVPSANYGVAVFTQATSASGLAGQTFESAFLGGTNYTESEVVNYIDSGMTDSSGTDKSAYNTFLDNLTGNYYNGVTAASTDPINAYMFTNGNYIGTVSSAQLTASGATPPFAGFGLTPESAAVPEPSGLSLCLVSAIPLAGIVISRRRRAA